MESKLHDSVKSVTAYGLLLSSYIHGYCDCETQKLFILIDFCQMHYMTEEILTQLLQLACIPLENLQVVVAMTVQEKDQITEISVNRSTIL